MQLLEVSELTLVSDAALCFCWSPNLKTIASQSEFKLSVTWDYQPISSSCCRFHRTLQQQVVLLLKCDAYRGLQTVQTLEIRQSHLQVLCVNVLSQGHVSHWQLGQRDSLALETRCWVRDGEVQDLTPATKKQHFPQPTPSGFFSTSISPGGDGSVLWPLRGQHFDRSCIQRKQPGQPSDSSVR